MSKMVIEAGCDCGQLNYSIHGKPLFRFYCHCLVCQEFNSAAYADVTLFRSDDVDAPAREQLSYQYFTKPPVVERGKCANCQQPVLEWVNTPLMPSLALVPSSRLIEQSCLPESSLHMFYHRRRQDITDALPKHSGYLKSQTAFFIHLMRSLKRKGGVQ